MFATNKLTLRDLRATKRLQVLLFRKEKVLPSFWTLAGSILLESFTQIQSNILGGAWGLEGELRTLDGGLTTSSSTKNQWTKWKTPVSTMTSSEVTIAPLSLPLKLNDLSIKLMEYINRDDSVSITSFWISATNASYIALLAFSSAPFKVFCGSSNNRIDILACYHM